MFGVPCKEGIERTKDGDWKVIESFINSKIWWNDNIFDCDKNDPLLENKIPYGAFMLGFDFHLTKDGPKLIEINTNAGGLATVFTFSVVKDENSFKELERKHITKNFLKAMDQEYCIAKNFIKSQNKNSNLPEKLSVVAIVDDNVTSQGLYSEMLEFKRIIEENEMKAFVVSPEELQYNEEEQSLYFKEDRIDFVYNRISSDFRLKMDKYKGIRNASIAGQIVLSPHPASYVRIADKRNLGLILQKIESFETQPIYHSVVPKILSMKEKTIEEWTKERKKWVFKPPEGNGSKGVYRGDKISATKLKTLPIETTLAQEYCPPSISEDGTKLDFRVFTRDTFVLGLATRHFTGQVMEMRSKKSGFKMALPESVCCFYILTEEAKNKNGICDSLCTPTVN